MSQASLKSVGITKVVKYRSKAGIVEALDRDSTNPNFWLVNDKAGIHQKRITVPRKSFVGSESSQLREKRFTRVGSRGTFCFLFFCVFNLSNLWFAISFSRCLIVAPFDLIFASILLLNLYSIPLKLKYQSREIEN